MQQRLQDMGSRRSSNLILIKYLMAHYYMVKILAKRTRWTDYPLSNKILFLTEAIFTAYCRAQRKATNSLNVDLIKFYND